MAAVKAVSLISSAILEAASVIEMELVMFAVAAMVYLVYVSGKQGGGRARVKGMTKKAKSMYEDASQTGKGGHQTNDGAVLKAWQTAKTLEAAPTPDLDLAAVADALRKSGLSVKEVLDEFGSVAERSPWFLRSLTALPAALLRDDAAELLRGVVALLRARGESVDASIYAGLMGAQLRRRDFAGVAETATQVSIENVTPKMHAMLAVAAASRGRLDESLGHLRQMPAPAEGTRCVLPIGQVAHIVTLALREQCLPAVREQLLRIGVESKQLGDLLASKVGGEAARRRGAPRPADASGSRGGERGDTSSQPPLLGPFGAPETQRQTAMIKSCAREKNLAGAREIFERLRAGGAQVSPQVCNCFLDACVQCGDTEAASKHFEEMKELGFADVVGYNTILKAYLSQGLTQEARNLVQEMTQRGLQPNKVTYNELLHAKVIAHDRQGMWALVDEMREVGVRANSVTCSILLKSLTAVSNPWDIKRVTSLIDEIEEPIDEVLFCSIIEACIRLQQLDLLSELMQRNRQKGVEVNLSAPTYGSMIKAYGRAGNAERVRELWEEMEVHGVQPTAITLGCMVEALVMNTHADEAWDLIHQQELLSEERKGFINTVVYSTVLKGFAVTRRLDKVFAVYDEMRGKGIPCNTITYNTMLDACAKGCRMSRASTLLEDMRETCIEPDIITYSTIIKGYCTEGDVDRAFCILTEMKRDGKFSPDEIMYNSVLDGCAKQHRVEEALKILDEMKASGVGPSNYTLSILVKILGHARRLNQAFRVVEELSSQNGFRPNIHVYTCLVQACALNRQLDRAFAVHDTVAADPSVHVDEKFYGVFARCCLQMHQHLKAAEVVRAAYRIQSADGALAQSQRRGPPPGVEARVLEEVAARLQGGGTEERAIYEALAADLSERCGVQLCAGGFGCGSTRGNFGGRRGGRDEASGPSGRRQACGGRGGAR